MLQQDIRDECFTDTLQRRPQISELHTSSASSLPTLLFTPGIQMPGASHVLAQKRGPPVAWRRTMLVALCVITLLCLLVLIQAGAVHPKTLQADSHQDILTPAPIQTALRETLPPRWDAALSAHPRKGQFLRFFQMRATAYTPINTRMEGGRYTVTRRDGRAAHGVAVDPSLIALGSRLWIPGYGYAFADDIGGRIQGHHVDLRVQRRGNMNDWGYRHLRIYVLTEPLSPLSR